VAVDGAAAGAVTEDREPGRIRARTRRAGLAGDEAHLLALLGGAEERPAEVVAHEPAKVGGVETIAPDAQAPLGLSSVVTSWGSMPGATR